MSTGGGGGRGGGGAEVVGGIEAVASLDTTQIESGFNRIKSSIGSVETSTRRFDTSMGGAAAGMDKAGTRAASLSRGILEVTRGFEDFTTGGFLGVLNNIPVAFQAIGTAAGISATAIGFLTAGISAAGTVAYIAYRNWDRLTDAFSGDTTKTAAEEMEQLGKQTSRTAEEQKRLNELKREEQQIEAQRNRRPGAAGEEQKQVGGAIQESPYDVLVRDVRGVMLKEAEGNIEPEVERRMQAERERRANPLNMRHGIPISTEEFQQIQDDVTDQLRKNVGAQAAELVRGAEFGSGRESRQLQEMARQNPGMVGLRRFVEGLNPERGFAPVVEGHVQARGEALLREGEREAEAEAVRKRALDADHEAAVERGAHVAAGQEERRKLNEDALERFKRENRQFDDAAERGEEHTKRLGMLGRRLREAMAPEVRNSMVMDSSQLNASVQASVTNGPSAEEKRLVEVRDAIKAIGDEIVRFNKPVRAGGR